MPKATKTGSTIRRSARGPDVAHCCCELGARSRLYAAAERAGSADPAEAAELDAMADRIMRFRLRSAADMQAAVWALGDPHAAPWLNRAIDRTPAPRRKRQPPEAV